MIFKSIKFKNFLSYGNKWTEITFNNNKLILINGQNGLGKSSIVEAIYFGCFGKPYRNIKKEELINYINKKSTVVVLNIESKGHEWKITRGLKPNIFNIHKDGVLVDQDSSVLDYQTIIEQQIGITSDLFKNSILLDSKFSSFLELSQTKRQQYFENILNIEIFHQIMQQVKLTLQQRKQAFIQFDKQLAVINSKIEQIEEVIELNSQPIQPNDDQIKDYKDKLNLINQHINDLDKKLEQALSTQTTLKKHMTRFNDIKSKKYHVEQSIYDINNMLKDDVCPLCLTEHLEDNTAIHNHLSQLETQMIQLQELYEKFKRIEEKLIKLDEQIKLINSKKYSYKDKELNIKNKILKIEQTNTNKNIDNKSTMYLLPKIDELKEESVLIVDKIKSNLEDQRLFDLMINLLTEKGIKQYIIERYIPTFNSLIMKYLTIFDCEFTLTINNDLSETLSIYQYTNLKYGNLSAGEKQRLDVALMFALLDLSTTKTSSKTNLLIIDEYLDKSLDEMGLDSFFNILNTLKKQDKTILVISHRQTNLSSYDEVYNVEKNMFSELSINS